MPSSPSAASRKSSLSRPARSWSTRSNSEVASTITEAQIRELPTITRNVYDSSPWRVTSPATISLGAAPAMRSTASASASTNVLLDGSANNDEFDATVGQEVPLDSVQEFSVITNNFSAQYGRATGGIVNVATKSGTNRFQRHGYDFFRNDALVDQHRRQPGQRYRKGRVHPASGWLQYWRPGQARQDAFLQSLEYIRVRSADTEISWVPTSSSSRASSPRLRRSSTLTASSASTGSQTLDAWRRSRRSSAPGPVRSIICRRTCPSSRASRSTLPIDAGGGDPQDNYQWVNRVDYSFGNNSQMYVRYAYQNQEAQPGTNASSPYDGYDTGYVEPQPQRARFVHARVLADVHDAKQGRVEPAVRRPAAQRRPAAHAVYESDRPPFACRGIGSPSPAICRGARAAPFRSAARNNSSSSIRIRPGSKESTTSASAVRSSASRMTAPSAPMPTPWSRSTRRPTPWSRSTTSCRASILRFQTAIDPNGFPGGTYTTPVSLPSFDSKNQYNEFAFYLNDNWSISDRVTVNLGIRYEYYGPQKKSDPKYDSNFYYRDRRRLGEHGEPAEMIAGAAQRRRPPDQRKPHRRTVEERLE